MKGQVVGPRPRRPGGGSSVVAADGSAAALLHRVFRSRRRLRRAAASLAALAFASLALPALLVTDEDAALVLDGLRSLSGGMGEGGIRGGISGRGIGSLVASPLAAAAAVARSSAASSPPQSSRILSGDDDEGLAADVMGSVEDNPRLLPRPPPPLSEGAADEPPLPPYTLEDVLSTMKHFQQSFAALVYDPETDQFVMHYSNGMRWTASCHKLVTSVKAVAHSLRMMFPERFQQDQPELVLGLSAADYPGIKWNECLRQERLDCLVPEGAYWAGGTEGEGGEPQSSGLAPVLHFGSVFRRPIFPSMVAMPIPQINHLSCFHDWAMHHRVCTSYLPREPSNPAGLVFGETIGLEWDDLIPQVVWRGTDFSYLHKMVPNLRQPDFEADVSGRIDPSERADKRTAATNALRQVYDQLIPRWKGVVWTAEAERAAKAIDQRALNREKRMNRRAVRDVLRNKKRARKGEKRIERERRQEAVRGGEEALKQLRNGPTLPWCNIKFAAAMHQGKKTATSEVEYYQKFQEFGIPAIGEGMSLEDLGRYKYHIDLGGGGGTTWSGTLEKLGLPGLLFHHVTPTKDYIHDAMVPWVHYVPIKSDLSDLREKYEWAENHPRMARQISDNATLLARSLGTPEGMDALFRRFFEGRLRRAVEAYRPVEGGDWRSAVRLNARPVLQCGGHFQHGCERLADDVEFTRLHDRDVDASGRKG